MRPRAVSHLKLLTPKWFFEAKTPVFTPVQYITVPTILLRLEYIFSGPSGGWGTVKVYWPCAGGLTAVSAVGTELRDPITRDWPDGVRRL